MDILPLLLLAQGAMGGVDTIVNHELVARLPKRPEARPELRLHVVREAIYATFFIGLAWWEWHGAAALAIAALVAAEIGITAGDEFVENRTRLLPQNERVVHVFLTLNLGLIIAVLAPRLLEWDAQPTAWVARDGGLAAWILTAMGLVSAAWSVRDLLAFRRLGGTMNAATNPGNPT